MSKKIQYHNNLLVHHLAGGMCPVCYKNPGGYCTNPISLDTHSNPYCFSNIYTSAYHCYRGHANSNGYTNVYVYTALHSYHYSDTNNHSLTYKYA